jgi:hypothetical protein
VLALFLGCAAEGASTEIFRICSSSTIGTAGNCVRNEEALRIPYKALTVEISRFSSWGWVCPRNSGKFAFEQKLLAHKGRGLAPISRAP